MTTASLDWQDPVLDNFLRVSGELSEVLQTFEERTVKVGASMLEDLIKKTTVDVVDKIGYTEGPVKEYLTKFAYKVGEIQNSTLSIVAQHSLDKDSLVYVGKAIYTHHFDMVNT